MRDAARDALRFASGRARTDLDDDRMLTLALVKCIEIIGEAAVNTSEETRRSLPVLPWRAIVGMRNRLAHAYFDVNLDIVWSTVTDDLPPLVATLEVHLGQATSSGQMSSESPPTQD